MYQNKDKNFENIKCLLLDILTIQIALIISYLLRHQFTFVYLDIYSRLSLNILIVQIILALIINPYKQLIQRTYNQELLESIKYVIYLMFLVLIYMFISQSTYSYSRIFLVLFFTISIKFAPFEYMSARGRGLNPRSIYFIAINCRAI